MDGVGRVGGGRVEALDTLQYLSSPTVWKTLSPTTHQSGCTQRSELLWVSKEKKRRKSLHVSTCAPKGVQSTR